MMIRLGFFVAASVAAYAVKQVTVNTLSKPSGSGEECFKYITDMEEEQTVVNITDSEDSKKISTPLKSEIDDKDEDKEVECLRSLVSEMEDMQDNKRRKLLLYYGLKEQEQQIFELKKRLHMITIETNRLHLTTESLKAQNRHLQEETMQSVLIKKQLEKAEIKINELQQEIRAVAGQRKKQVMMLKEQLETIQAYDSPHSDAEIQKKLEKGNDLQLEATKLRRRQREIQLENRVLAIKMVVVEARANAIANTTESEVMKSIRVQRNASLLANEELQKQVESLQKDRFHAVEELVYHRWVNTCLRHEVQTYKTPCRKTSVSDSQRSSIECNMYEPFEENSKGEETRIRRKTSLIEKVKRWRRSIDTSSVVSSLNRSFGSSSGGTSSTESGNRRRSSFSIGSFGTPALKLLRDRAVVGPFEKSSGDSPDLDLARVPFRRRRVSFNDSLNTTKTLHEEKYADEDRGKIVTETEKTIKERVDEVKTDWFTDDPDAVSTSETGELLLREENIDGNNATATATEVETEIRQTSDHAENEKFDPVMPQSPDAGTSVQNRVLHSDAIFVFCVMVVAMLYLFLRTIS